MEFSERLKKCGILVGRNASWARENCEALASIGEKVFAGKDGISLDEVCSLASGFIKTDDPADFLERLFLECGEAEVEVPDGIAAKTKIGEAFLLLVSRKDSTALSVHTCPPVNPNQFFSRIIRISCGNSTDSKHFFLVPRNPWDGGKEVLIAEFIAAMTLGAAGRMNAAVKTI